MSRARNATTLRVEQVLRLLPEVDALGPLRAFLVSTSRVEPSAETYRTVGKRYVRSADMEDLVPRALASVTAHLSTLYRFAIDAMEADERGDPGAAIQAFLRAGELESNVGRDTEARVWYEHSLAMAKELRDRQPEIEALLRIGRLESEHRNLETASRCFQRALALAESEMDDVNAALACLGLGDASVAHGRAPGAAAWYTKGLQFAAGDDALAANLRAGMATVALNREQADEALNWVRQALAAFEESNDQDGVARTLDIRGRVEAQKGDRKSALASYREALMNLHSVSQSARTEMAIRLDLCELYLDWGRLPDTEDEIRRAEELAIVNNFTRELARLYVLMGRVRGRQSDDAGFVFFEKAIELCRGREPAPRLEAEAYLEYGRFRKALGDPEEARAYFERAREILEDVGNGFTLAQVDAELATLPPY